MTWRRSLVGRLWLSRVVFSLVVVLGLSLGAQAQFNTEAGQAVVYDYETWQILYTKNADQPMAPSSMTKIMTAYVVFDALEKGEVTLGQRLRVSERAYRPEGSRMWLGLDTRVSVDSLLKGLIVQSGNDAAVVLAEGVSGSVGGFVERMNSVAQALGMTGTHFMNPSGLNQEGHYSTANDIARLSRALIADFPHYYPYFSIGNYSYAGIAQTNRNLLLGGRLGVDGIKTGYTQAGKYGQATSALDPSTGRRVIVVFNGVPSIAIRKREAERLVEFGLDAFTNHDLLAVGQVIGYAPVWLGEEAQIPLVVHRTIRRTLRRDAIHNMQGTLVLYQSPLNAPIEAGQEVGRLLYFSLGMSGETAPFEEPVYAGKGVTALSRVEAAIEGVRRYLL